jgi:hypothetical protein
MSKRALIAAIVAATSLVVGAIALTLRSKQQTSAQATPSVQTGQGESAAPEQDRSNLTSEQAAAPEHNGFVPPPSVATGQSAPVSQ